MTSLIASKIIGASVSRPFFGNEIASQYVPPAIRIFVLTLRALLAAATAATLLIVLKGSIWLPEL
jgi:hypothetical protein